VGSSSLLCDFECSCRFCLLFIEFVKLVQIILIKSRRMRWTEHVARKGKEGSVLRVLAGKPEGRDHLENLGVDGNVEY
jgi:hypothetical protein